MPFLVVLGRDILIKSYDMGRCWGLSIDYPNCLIARYRGNFNNLKYGCQRLWLFLAVSSIYLFPPQGEFWWGPFLGQVWFHIATSFRGLGDGGGRSRDPHHDVSISLLWQKRDWRPQFPFIDRLSISLGNTRNDFFLRPEFPHLWKRNV